MIRRVFSTLVLMGNIVVFASEVLIISPIILFVAVVAFLVVQCGMFYMPPAIADAASFLRGDFVVVRCICITQGVTIGRDVATGPSYDVFKEWYILTDSRRGGHSWSFIFLLACKSAGVILPPFGAVFT